MSNRAKSIPELLALTAPAADDLLVVVDVSANTTKKATVGTMVAVVGDTDLTFANNRTLSVNNLVVRKNETPANGTSITIGPGQIFYDAQYLYISVANNVVKRIALEAF